MRHLLSIALGVVAGLVTALVVDGLRAPDEPAHAELVLTPRLVEAPLAAAPPAVPGVEVSAAAADEPPAAKGELPPPDLDPEAARALVLARLDELERLQDSEPLDPDWAGRARQAFAGNLAAIGSESELTVLDVDCKTERCAARVRWPSYGSAVNHYAVLLHHRYRENCAREVLLPEPGNPAAAYEATAYYDCTESRGGPL